MRKLKIAVASGKGGTGKTMVATNLAVLAVKRQMAVTYYDCDVEEPNGHLFLNPSWSQKQSVDVLVPQVDTAKCTACGKCSQVCRFNAVVQIKENVQVYPELCHACGGCGLLCPVQAITDIPKSIGELAIGKSEQLAVVQGTLTIGQAMSPPLIRAVKAAAQQEELGIIDAPPGTSCPLVAAVHGCHYTILVTEATPFGLHDLKLTVSLMRSIKMDFGVVINRADSGHGGVVDYCQENHINILAQIPFSRAIAECYSRGNLVVKALPDYRQYFEQILDEISLPEIEKGDV